MENEKGEVKSEQIVNLTIIVNYRIIPWLTLAKK